MRKDNAVYIRISSEEKEEIRQEANKKNMNLSEFFFYLWQIWKSKK